MTEQLLDIARPAVAAPGEFTRAMSELRRFRGDVEPADWRVPDE